MKRQLFSGLLILVMLLLVFSTACGTPAPATTAAPTQTTAPTTQPAQVYKLKYSTSMVAVEPPIVMATRMLDNIEKQSNGRIKVDRFIGGTLGKSNEQFGLISGGSVDFASISMSWIRDKLPLHSYMNWMIGGQDKPVTLMRKLNFEMPEPKAILDKENADNGITILTFLPVGQNGIISKVTFTKLSDLKGKKIGTNPNYRALDAMGLTTVSMVIPDIYEGLAKGVIDAQCLAMTPMLALKWYEVCKCYMADGHTSAGQFIGMNAKTYNSLPADLQKIIKDAALETAKWGETYIAQEEQKAITTVFKNAGLTTGILPESDQQQMFALEYKFRAKDMIDLCTPMGKADQAKEVLKYLDQVTGFSSF